MGDEADIAAVSQGDVEASSASSVAFLQATIPDYRVPIVDELRKRLDGRLVVVCGDDDFSPGVTIGPELSCHVLVENVYLAGRRLLWQRRTLRETTRVETLLLDLNPRILNAWIAMVVRRIRGRRTIVYGHAWPRKGATARSDRVRHLMRRLANGIIVYTASQADELARRMPNRAIHAAPNALYPRALAVHDASERRARDVLYVGRLVEAKKPLLLVDAFAAATPMLPEDTRLVFVGEGPLRGTLEAHAQALGIDHRVDFEGHVGEFARLQALYARALVSVSPGYTGLSLTQSLWFGVPALIADDEPHAPEIEAAEPGLNSRYFRSNSPAALSKALIDMYEERDLWLGRAQEIADACVERYSLESMVDSIVRALEK